jgi:endonuclease/exonuclease/phosphatase family metal-dependent hydrolase
VYIPPKQSTYSSEEAFNELEDEIIFVSKNTKHITLVGDFNSKTSTLEYFIISDQDLLQLLDLSENDELIKDLYMTMKIW